MRRIWAGLLTGVIGVMGGSALSLQAYSKVRPEAAQLIPWSSEAQKQAAQAAIGKGSRQAAAKFGKHAVAAMPIDQFALAVSSPAMPPERQLIILNLAAALGWRDAATNIALVEAALREAEPVVAAQRIDALGRTIGAETATPLTDRLLGIEGGIAALAVRAQTRTGRGWWEGYFRSRPANRKIAEQRTALLGQFDRADGAWLAIMIRDAAIGFSKSGYDDLTMQAWRASLPPGAPFAGPIYDPQFTKGVPKAAAIGGEWQLARAAPVLISKAENGGIVIERTQDASGPIFSQLLSVGPGQWRFGVDGTATGTPELEWRMSCAGKSAGNSGHQLSKTSGDKDYAITIAAGCPTARLTLFAAPKQGADEAIFELRRLTMVRAEQ